MPRDEKLIERLRRRPPRADYSDIERLLLNEGWVKMRQKGSHVSFKKTGSPTITVPLVEGRRVKRVYIDLVFRILGLDE